jgi:uncharacterized tellurite resistance protein B-like protein
MAVSPAALQVRRDAELRKTLAADSGVKRALARIEERTSGFGFSGRRSLLTGALRLTRSMSPEVADAVADCKARIGYERPVEVYVKPDPMLNAFCMHNAVGPAIVCLSSRLLEVFSPAELKFVIGHELGHAVFDHLGMAMPLLATIEDMGGTIVSRPVSLSLYLWCRAAELSADRIGMVCAGDPEAAASGFFKLASGLSSPRVKADLEAYSRQIDSLASTPEARSKPRDDDDTLDCFATHPYSPLRVRAVVAFARSRPYQEAIGRADGGAPISKDDLEAIVERDLELMEPNYLEEKDPASVKMRRLLYSAGVSIAAADGDVTPAEVKALTVLLGADQVSGAIDVEKNRKDLEARIEEVKDLPLGSRAQLVQHLTIIAAADGQVSAAEAAEMHRIASRLGVDAHVVEQTLAGSSSPLD